LKHGLVATQRWWSKQLSKDNFNSLTKKTSRPIDKSSISAIIACYKDAEAVPVMYERLQKVFTSNNIDYEIIFVNDCSPDNTSDIIMAISASDPCVIGINHSRNFGSQAAFRSGMNLATKEAVVLLDGDLQDPPEIIPSFIQKWRSGADVVYGRRSQRQMGLIQLFLFRSFYRVFSLLSDIPMPRDAGDFSLIDRKVVHWILNCQERDSLIRGLRAYVGFNQVAVDYYRPERMFGSSTNNLIRNLGWAKMAIFSFSQLPLHALTALGLFMLAVTILIAIYSLFILFVFPEQAPRGITFLILLVLMFGSSTLLGLGILGEYIGKILAEAKRRPHYIPASLIRDGQMISSEA
jgi:dolichol-phosphate mannosyltransferase